MNRGVFLLAALGSSIGLGNIWKYPYLAWKHGGVIWIGAYVFTMFIVGIPMLILELTLGQKMQRGSAGSIRGILPRFAGAGWAASFASFITCVVYIILLGIVAIYLFNSGSKPW
jgi:NSS family neurotransmitter:Na+ symporter